MKTDEQIAKEASIDFIYPESGYNLPNFVRAERKDAFEKGRELSDEKALRFGEFLAKCETDIGKDSIKLWGIRSDNLKYIYWFTTSELYTSKAFEDYLNGLPDGVKS